MSNQSLKTSPTPIFMKFSTVVHTKTFCSIVIEDIAFLKVTEPDLYNDGYSKVHNSASYKTRQCYTHWHLRGLHMVHELFYCSFFLY